MHELKLYRGVLCHDNEELYKNWRGTDLSVQNWHEEFGKFGPEHSKIPITCILIGCFWPKYIMFELKKRIARGVMFDGTEVMQNLKENWLVLSKNFHLQAEK